LQRTAGPYSDQRDAPRAEFLRAGEFTAAPVKTMRRSGLRSVPALLQSGFNASPPASRQVHAQVRACLSPLEEVDNALSAVGAGVEPNHPIHRIPLEKMVEAIRISKERDKRLKAAIEEPACDGADCRLPFRSQSPLSAGASEFLQPPGRLPHPPMREIDMLRSRPSLELQQPPALPRDNYEAPLMPGPMFSSRQQRTIGHAFRTIGSEHRPRLAPRHFGHL
jgi:hypothetical protein